MRPASPPKEEAVVKRTLSQEFAAIQEVARGSATDKQRPKTRSQTSLDSEKLVGDEMGKQMERLAEHFQQATTEFFIMLPNNSRIQRPI